MVPGLLAAAVVLAFAIWWLRRRFMVITVTGRSMEPGYHHGDRVLVRRRPVTAVRAGQVAVLAATGGGWMIKRIAAAPGDPAPAFLRGVGTAVPAGMLAVLGDNTALSDDSRRLGYLDGDLLLGVVVHTLTPATRTSGRAAKPTGTGTAPP